MQVNTFHIHKKWCILGFRNTVLQTLVIIVEGCVQNKEDMSVFPTSVLSLSICSIFFYLHLVLHWLEPSGNITEDWIWNKLLSVCTDTHTKKNTKQKLYPKCYTKKNVQIEE